MTTPTTTTDPVSELLGRVRAATGPDRELDFAIERINLGELAYIIDHWSSAQRHDLIAHYTASIGAALALVNRKLPGWMVVNLCEWEADVLRARGPWQCILKELGTQDDMTAPKGREDHAPTAPLAILSALLLSLSTQEPK
jgi:hypothetical protein